MAEDENALAGRLIERLLVDPVFRGEFRRDPASACVAAGLPELAQELGGGAGSGMQTLELRESRGVVVGRSGDGGGGGGVCQVAEAQAFGARREGVAWRQTPGAAGAWGEGAARRGEGAGVGA